MTSAIEITAPAALQRRLGSAPLKSDTTYPFSQAYLDFDDNESEPILPYMTRIQSPVRVTVAPSALAAKRKSRVDDTAKTATFNYKPLKRGETSSLKFRVPDATTTTLPYLTQWLSVTKTDYRDPRLTESDVIDSSLGLPALYRRSLTDTSIELSRRNTAAVSRSESLRPLQLESRERLTTGGSTESSNTPSVQIAKRVKILDPSHIDTLQASTPSAEARRKVDGSFKVPTPSAVPKEVKEQSDSRQSPSQIRQKLAGIKQPENGLNYYNGYLPPEYSNAIAQSLRDIWKPNEDVKDEEKNHPDEFYKPLIGDRSLYMHKAYPIQPKLMQYEIDQLRLEGRRRFLQSVGQAPVHFSALKDRGTLVRPKQKGVQFDAAVRAQNLRQFKSAKLSRQPANETSMEIFQQQRERTYHLQTLAREMINDSKNQEKIE